MVSFSRHGVFGGLLRLFRSSPKMASGTFDRRFLVLEESLAGLGGIFGGLRGTF